MLESMLNPKVARNNLLEVFVVTIIFSLIAVFFSYYLFPEYASVLASAEITILFSPFFQRLFASEEAVEEFAIKHHLKKNQNLFQRHAPVLKIYSVFFLGLILTMSVLFFFLPNGIRDTLFEKQISEVERLSGISISGNLVVSGSQEKIFFNNLFVLFLAFVTSLIYGTGAVFILSWNASVIGVYAGSFAKYLMVGGMAPIFAFAYGVPNALLAITMHGIPEVFGYFFAGMAGGILSAGLIKEKLHSPEMNILLFDSFIFLGVGVFSIFIGAFIEVGNTLFSTIGFLAYMVFIFGLILHGTQ